MQERPASVTEPVRADEIAPLLRRLSDMAEPAPAPDDVTLIRDVCETTGHAPEHVAEVLRRMRQEAEDERLSERLRELEEPLYRVERPGFATDPLRPRDPFQRLESVRRTFPAPAPPHLKLQQRPQALERLFGVVATLILLVTSCLFLWLAIHALRR